MARYILVLTLLFVSHINLLAQDIEFDYYCEDSFKNYYVFDSLNTPGRPYYKYFRGSYENNSAKAIDTSLCWYERSFAYWSTFQMAGYLLLEDKKMKELWDLGFDHDPSFMCRNFEDRVNPSKQTHNWFKHDKQFMPYLLRESKYYSCMCADYKRSFSQEIHDELADILKKDQSNNRDNNHESQVKIDNSNLERVEKIIVDLGKYPGLSLVGSELHDVAWLVLQHSDLETLLKYRELLRKTIFDDRELLPRYWAYTEDRILVWQGKKQKYGTQYYEEKGKVILNEVEDRQKVDELRKSLFMKPLYTYLKNNNIQYQEKSGKLIKF